MLDDWEMDLSWSAEVFSELVWPILEAELPGRMIHVEAIARDAYARKFMKDLDTLAGIDAWHIVDNVGIRGIASRVQECPYPYRPYNTFTIRKNRDSGTKTEYEKRKQAIDSNNGWIFPHLTVQSYVSAKRNGELRSFGVAKTADIINLIDQYNDDGQSSPFVYTKRTTNAEFYVVDWRINVCQITWPTIENGATATRMPKYDKPTPTQHAFDDTFWVSMMEQGPPP